MSPKVFAKTCRMQTFERMTLGERASVSWQAEIAAG